MRTIATLAAVLLTATFSFADVGTLHPGEDVMIGNLHVANLEGAGGDVTYISNATSVILVVNEDAFCAVLKKRDGTRQSHRITSLVVGGSYYAQANCSGSHIAVLGDNSVALSLALRARDTNNANTIDIAGNGNLVAAARWCFGKGRVLLNRIRFGLNGRNPGRNNDAYISGDLKGTRNLPWQNRTIGVAGRGNATIAFNGFACPKPDADRPDVVADEGTEDVARDAAELRDDGGDDAVEPADAATDG